MVGITERRRRGVGIPSSSDPSSSTSTTSIELQPLNTNNTNTSHNDHHPHDPNGSHTESNLLHGGNTTNNGYYHTATTPNAILSNGITTPSSSSSSSNHNNLNTYKRNTTNRFNPRLIFSQIVAIQSIHYLVLSFLFQINYVLFGTKITIDRIFTGRYLDLWTKEGWIDNGAVWLSSVIGAFLLAFIVEKSKKCLDFSVTLFTIHLVLCSLYNGGMPRSWDWWIVHIIGMLVMILMGEYLCSRVEMRDIPLLL